MHFRLFHDRVVVKRIEAEEKSAGSIIIPGTAKFRLDHGREKRRGGTTRLGLRP